MKKLLKKTPFKGTWGLKEPVIILALLFPLILIFFPNSARWSSYLQSIIYGLIILALVALKRATWEQLGLHREHWQQNLVLGGITGGLIILAVPLLDFGIQASGIGQTELFAGAENRSLETSDGNIPFVMYCGIVVGISLADQLFFTGYFLQALIRKSKPALAIYLGGLVFALAHFDLQLGIFLLGLITATFYWVTGSLVAPLLFQIACYIAGWLLAHHYPKVFTLLGFLF